MIVPQTLLLRETDPFDSDLLLLLDSNGVKKSRSNLHRSTHSKRSQRLQSRDSGYRSLTRLKFSGINRKTWGEFCALRVYTTE